MTYFIPIFPLPIVVYPQEVLNLHIFEERYKQMIADCIQYNKPFGVLTRIEGNLQDVGTSISQIEIINKHTDNKLDIKTKANNIFKVLEVLPNLPNKLYAGAVVTNLQDEPEKFKSKKELVLQEMRELHKALLLFKKIVKPDEELLSYDVAHWLGLNIKQEYELLNIFQENQRWEFLHRHLLTLKEVIHHKQEEHRRITIIENVQRNGHFRTLKD